MILYGRNAVREALRGRRPVLRIWATSDDVAREAGVEGVAVEVTDSATIEALCGSPAHQGLACETGAYPYADASALLRGPEPLVLALDQIQDPQNLGAICRCAEGAGAAGVVIPARRAAEITPAVCRASAGAVEHLPVARVRNLADFLREAKEGGAWVYGAEAGAGRLYTDVDWSGPAVLVLGSEGKGLRPRVRSACDDVLRVPLRGRVESLNVAAVAGILLFDAVRSRAGRAGGLDKST